MIIQGSCIANRAPATQNNKGTVAPNNKGTNPPLGVEVILIPLEEPPHLTAD